LSLVIREARPEDAGVVFGFIRALAEYEKLLHEVKANEAQIRATLFADNARIFCDIAEWNGVPAGFALWFYNYSTFLGRHGIWLEDLFVTPERRGQGIGKALLGALARRCTDEGLGRLEWAVLDWNELSIRFYRGLGAVPLDDWKSYCLTGEALHGLSRSLNDPVRR
jgi:GNAT superfamily N-acetyltransferase